MVKLIALGVALLLLSGCSATQVNRSLLATSTAALVVDWAQTRYIVANPKQHREANALIGNTEAGVNRYFIGAIAGNLLMFMLLPKEWEGYWAAGVLGLELGAIGTNIRSGVKFDWGF